MTWYIIKHKSSGWYFSFDYMITDSHDYAKLFSTEKDALVFIDLLVWEGYCNESELEVEQLIID